MLIPVDLDDVLNRAVRLAAMLRPAAFQPSDDRLILRASGRELLTPGMRHAAGGL